MVPTDEAKKQSVQAAGTPVKVVHSCIGAGTDDSQEEMSSECQTEQAEQDQGVA